MPWPASGAVGRSGGSNGWVLMAASLALKQNHYSPPPQELPNAMVGDGLYPRPVFCIHIKINLNAVKLQALKLQFADLQILPALTIDAYQLKSLKILSSL